MVGRTLESLSFDNTHAKSPETFYATLNPTLFSEEPHLVVVRLKGVLTPAERQLAKTTEGVEMVKQLRQNLIAQGRDKLCDQVSEITGTKVLGLFTDIDVQLSERVFVFTTDRDIQYGTRSQT